jgi:hypothetical protein
VRNLAARHIPAAAYSRRMRSPSLTPAGLFGVVVRSFGVFLVIHALTMLPDLVTAWNDASDSTDQLLLKIGWTLVVAAWLLVGAPPVQRLSYPESHKRTAEPDAAPPIEFATEQAPGKPCVSCEQSIPPQASTCPSCGWAQPA